jgi:esterase
VSTIRRLKADGRLICYKEWGPADGPALLAVHGLTSNSSVWEGLAQSLGTGHRIVAPDLRGHGFSDHIGNYNQQGFMEDIEVFVDTMGFQQFAVMGHSMGARLAWKLATIRPTQVTKTIIVDMVPYEPSDFPPTSAVPFLTVDDAVNSEMASDRAKLSRRELVEGVVRHNLDKVPGGWYWGYDIRLRNAPSQESSFADSIDEQRSQLATVPTPTLYVRPEFSYDSQEDSDRLLATIPDVKYAPIEDSGHDVHLDQPEELAEAVGAFLR